MTTELSNALTALCHTANFILVIYAIGLILEIINAIFPKEKKGNENKSVHDSEKDFE